MMVDLDLWSFVVGVLATLAIVTAWVNRPSREPYRTPRACGRRRSPSTEATLASIAETRRKVDAAMRTFAENAPQPEHVWFVPGPRPYDGDVDGWE